MSKSELACVYASLLLADDDIDITADKINTVLKAANIKFVEPFLPGLFANALHGKNVKDMLLNVGAVGAGAPAPAAGSAADGASAPAAGGDKKAEEKKAETESDSEASLNFDLFG
ncbi:Large subunit ribosomal protein LP1 [Fasciola gigantica]|uniref:Large ribosomal subunit protein P1 n=2 Tax=Fasciola TaxID=6191 RepID=A0A2H1BUI8_FASHE|nr:Large subunit ribosomal protein LP1 [Fasciola hepatica]TPP60243.1 Large subunit ribosomal protein LP1 [Fasciola gigantica]